MKISDVIGIAFLLAWILMIVCFCGSNCELATFFGLLSLIIGGAYAQIRKILKQRR